MLPDRLSLITAAGDTNSAGLSDINAAFLADVPLVAIGILGFAVAKLLFAFHGLTRSSIIILISVLAAFLGVTVDLFRIFQTTNRQGDDATHTLLVFREVLLALGIFIRYLFFIDYAARSSGADTEQRMRWSALRILSEVALLLVAFVMFILELVWRCNASLTNVYTADVVLQISWTIVVFLKMGTSIIVYPDPNSRWKFARLILPIMAALLLEWGISVGNAIMHNFADCSAGRFLQAVEVYIILLTLAAISISRLIARGPLTSLSNMSPIDDKGTRLNISNPTMPEGLPKFSFRLPPRRAPRPPRENDAESSTLQAMQGASDWLVAPRRDDDLRNFSRVKPRPLLARPVSYATPVSTPEISQWRTLSREPSASPEPDRPSPTTNALGLLSPRVVNLPMPTRNSRYYVPPPTPPPSIPLPVPPGSIRDDVRDSGIDVDASVLNQGPVSSTFGHITTIASLSRSPTQESRVAAAQRANRRSSAPLILISRPPDTPPSRAARALSNPGGGTMQQSVAALLREQAELEAAYPAASPNPRRSVFSVNVDAPVSADSALSHEAREGPSSVDSPEPISSVARESSRSDFSLSRFPAPPASSFRRAIAPLRSRFSDESKDVTSGSSHSTSTSKSRPLTLTVRTNLRRISATSPSERESSLTQWDVTSFIGGFSNSDGSPPGPPPPSAEPPMLASPVLEPVSVDRSPRPVFLRPPPRVRRNRNLDTVPPKLSPDEDDASDGEVMTRKATRAMRISRIRFVRPPPPMQASEARFSQVRPRLSRLSISGPRPLGSMSVARGSVGGVGRGAPADKGRALPTTPRPPIRI